jgi:hypothetical protein
MWNTYLYNLQSLDFGPRKKVKIEVFHILESYMGKIEKI